MPRREHVLASDVNETLLDLRALDEPFARVFGDAGLRPQWFQSMLQLAFVGGLTREYVDFTTAQHAALRMLAERVGRSVSDEQAETIVGGMRRLPAHPDAAEALRALRAAGFRSVTLTNSPLDVVRDQLDFAGLADLFDDVLSADEVRQLKPGPLPYRLVAERGGGDVLQVRLGAAPALGGRGGVAAGARGGVVAGAGGGVGPAGPAPGRGGGAP